MTGTKQRWMSKFGVMIAPVIIAVVLGIAGVAKASKLSEVEDTIAASHLVTGSLVSLAAKALVSLEIIVAVGLMLPYLRPVCAKFALVLFSTFISYSIWKWIHGIAVPCHCFGMIFKMNPLQSIALNVGLLALLSPLLSQLQLDDAAGKAAG